MRRRKLVTATMQAITRQACAEMGTTVEELHASKYCKERLVAKCRLSLIFFDWARFFERPTIRTIAECVGGPGTAHSQAMRWYREANEADREWVIAFMAKFGPIPNANAGLPDDDAIEEDNARRWRDRNRGRHLGPGLYRNFCCACGRPLEVSQMYATSHRVRCTPCVTAAATSPKSSKREVA